MKRTALLGAALLAACAETPKPSEPNPSAPEATAVTDKPRKGDVVADFAVDALYTGEGGGVAGVRWVHRGHGMPVTTLRIQSVPQVFLAFNTPPVSDRGEPHTGEHLLLGKGAKGKVLSAEQGMSLVESTAWTAQTDVCYSWSCAAGKDTFFRSVEQYLDALLLPDYSDEEIRREVCHVGPVKDQATGKLSLDEKGTIYQEMTSTYEKRWIVWNEMQKRLWGVGHPLSYSAGGEPAAVRACSPEHVSDFHAAHYHLGADTEMIVALPDSIGETEFLTKLSAQMAAVDKDPRLVARGKKVHAIPPGRPQSDRSVLIQPYPNANEDDVGMAVFVWTPVPLGPLEDRVRVALLLSTLGDGESATLYKRLMDRSTREVAVDAAQMASGLDASRIDLAPYVYFDGVPAANATPARMEEIGKVLRDEIGRVAALAPGSDALKAFNDQALDKLALREKGLRKALNSPPLFGHRGAGGFWLDHLRLLDQGGGFERSVTLAPIFEAVRAELRAGANPWTRVVGVFGLGGAPYVGVSKPSKAELEKRTAEHARRVEGYVADVAKRYGGEPQQALAKFAAEYDAKTAELDAAEKNLAKPRLVPDVPLTRDPSIRLEEVEAGGVPGFRGVFDNMTFVQTSVSLRLEGVPTELYPWLAVLPDFLTESGVVEDGKAVPYDEAERRRSREIYALDAGYSMRPSRGRHELRISATGADVAEAKRAVDWIDLSLRHARLDVDNLPRLRDLVQKAIGEARVSLGGAEESWVEDPATAVRRQKDELFLSTSSLHARLFQLARCEWRLMDAPTGEDEAVVRRQSDALAQLGASGGDAKAVAAGIESLLATWRASKSPANDKWVVPIASRIKEMVGDMAPTTLAADLRTLVEVATADVLVPPTDALTEVRRVRDTLLAKHAARFVLTGSRANTDALLPRVGTFFTAFAKTQPQPQFRLGDGVVDRRLADHEKVAKPILHYGFVHERGSSGVFVLSAGAGRLDELDDATLAEDLAARVFGGAGAHALFMRTWGAGLAYSNGLSVDPFEGRIRYYAERCPDLVRTMSFVSDTVRGAQTFEDPYLAEYAVATAVAHSRESDEYEARARAAADEIVDGDTPERIKRWRKAVLAMKDRPGVWADLKPRVVPSVGRALPDVDPKSRDTADGVFFVIAPAPMLERWEAHVRAHEGADVRVHRIYGRDFWLVPR